MMNMDKGPHTPMHWGCCWLPMLGVLLWVFGLLAFLGGLLALWQGGEFLGVAVVTWYWNALVAGVLAVGAKVARLHHHMTQR